MNRLLYKLNSGKNNKLLYFVKNIIVCSLPNFIFRYRLNKKLNQFRLKALSDPSLNERLNYYNKLQNTTINKEDFTPLSQHKYSKKIASVYFFDTYIYTRWFNPKFYWSYAFGDITYVPNQPSIVKSRPIGNHNEFSVLMKLDKVRHFTFLNDKKSFGEKKDMIIFRGKVDNKESRIMFMQKFFGHPMCDLGDVSKRNINPSAWKTEKKTLKQHLDYKFVLALEGNDVASNLKWIMSSNSIAVMPKPTYETWFMEGTLIPDFHYIEIKSSYSDLEEKLNYYINNPEKAIEIINNANNYVAQFMNEENEELLSLMVLDKYFKQLNQ